MKDNMLAITLVLGTFFITLVLVAIINLIAGLWLVTHTDTEIFKTGCTTPEITQGDGWAAPSQECK